MQQIEMMKSRSSKQDAKYRYKKAQALMVAAAAAVCQKLLLLGRASSHMEPGFAEEILLPATCNYNASGAG
jgi:hypothetical protein